MKMPELPAPGGIWEGVWMYPDGEQTIRPGCEYTTDQMRAYGELVRQECARLCNNMAGEFIDRGKTLNWEYRAHGAEACADAILRTDP